jgi:hypothetical protein
MQIYPQKSELDQQAMQIREYITELFENYSFESELKEAFIEQKPRQINLPMKLIPSKGTCFRCCLPGYGLVVSLQKATRNWFRKS